ncbi:hypothetical protein Clacol_003798 [Clathrus columnatus]|uniref:Exoribonuclease phosphorolytic domain-containing protein n=1 Tax=Clathrus columnatus TaxID=1419009 RepID=A0AAV5A9G5_9AGAM|nr:hypothetical protein Clacol_003798 [Clathrus columnatus]
MKVQYQFILKKKLTKPTRQNVKKDQEIISGQYDAEDRSLSSLIHQGLAPSLRLDLLPKSCVDVFVTILEEDGIEGCAASGIIAASTALANAGIEMYGLVTACSSIIVANEVWLDPTKTESERSQSSLILACMPALGTVTCLSQTGSMTAMHGTMSDAL